MGNSGLIYANNTNSDMTNLFTNDENKSFEETSNISVNSVNTEKNFSGSSVTNSSDSNSAIDKQSDTSSENINNGANDSVNSTNKSSTSNDNDKSINKPNNTIADNNQTIVKNNTELNNKTDSKVVADKTDSKKVEQYAGAPATKFTKNELLSAATALKKYVEKYGKLPDYLTLDGCKLAMSDFLYLLSKVVININGGSNSDITSKDVKDPSYPSGSSTNGNLYKSSYIDLAKRVASYIDNNGQAPNYGNSNLGKIQFQTMIYGFAKIADYFKVHKVMPNYVFFIKSISTDLNKVNPKYSGNNGLVVSGGDTKPDDTKPDDSGSDDDKPAPTGSVSLANIKDAGARVEAYVEKNGILPKYVTINGKDYSMTQFLYLTSKAIVNINKGISSAITAKTFKTPSKASGSSINGNIDKSDFVDLATRVSNYMTSNGQAPNYGSSTLGNMQFQTMIYGFSMILEFTKSEGRLPNYLTLNVKSSSTLNGGSDSSSDDGDSGSDSGDDGNFPINRLNEKYKGESLAQYLKATMNCQVNDATIIAKAKELTKGLTSDLSKATKIFNFVRDSIRYESYWNSHPNPSNAGAKNVLRQKWGNCVDKTHLLIALCRASGIAARYVNADNCLFSGGDYIGHVWAQIKIGDTWVVADTTSSRNSIGVVNNWNINTGYIKGKYAEITF